MTDLSAFTIAILVSISLSSLLDFFFGGIPPSAYTARYNRWQGLDVADARACATSSCQSRVGSKAGVSYARNHAYKLYCLWTSFGNSAAPSAQCQVPDGEPSRPSSLILFGDAVGPTTHDNKAWDIHEFRFQIRIIRRRSTCTRIMYCILPMLRIYVIPVESEHTQLMQAYIKRHRHPVYPILALKPYDVKRKP